MPIYEEEGRLTKDELLELQRYNKCKECGGILNVFYDFDSHKAFLACTDWPRSHHEGVEREASRYEKEGLASLNIPKRREIMEKELGTEKTRALAKYMGVVSLTKSQAREILLSVYPDAPESEITRAVILCASYGLNPLMKHVFLIKFNRWNKGHTEIIGEDWVTVMGIKAKRLLSSRQGNYSYVDNTPRVMTEQEQRDTFGEIDGSKLWVITKVKDPQTGAESVGYGNIGRGEKIQGEEKGNTRFNMAAIRSESQALDRLRPGEMPEGIEVVPEEAAEAVIEGEFKEVKEEAVAPEPKQHWCEEHNCAFVLKKSRFGSFYAHKKPEGGWCNELKKKEPVPKAAPHIPENTEDLPSNEPEPEAKAEPEPQQLKRDPDTIKTLNDLYRACNEDFKLQPAQVLAELNVSSQTEIAETPAWCYRKIAAVR